MTETILNVEITVRAPFLFTGTGVGRFGYDKTAIRDHNGIPIIPEDQVKGLLRHGLHAMGHDDLIRTLLGAETNDARNSTTDGLEPSRGRIFLTDFMSKTRRDAKATNYHRVQIEEESGAAKQGHFVRVEQIYRPKTEVTFSGSIVIFQSQKASELASIIKTALSFHTHVGALTSIGFGEVMRIKANAEKHATPKVALSGAGRYQWVFKLDRPYLVNADRQADNAFVGDETIPGGALKGLIAHMAELHGVHIDAKSLSDAVIGHARQVQRPIIPASVVYVPSKGTFLNIAFEDFPEDGILQIDWKSDIFDRYFAAEPPQAMRQERVHTRIDVTTGAAKDRQLFSTVSIVPSANETFSCLLDTSMLGANANPIMQLIGTSLHGLGKTNACVKTVALKNPTDAQNVNSSGKHVIMLTTDAFLELQASKAPLVSYDIAFKKLFPKSTILAALCNQKMAGSYLGKRFSPNGKYQPWILTKAGSIFVINLDVDDLTAFNRVLSSGIMSSERDGVRLDWQNCPFVPENGYGAIKILNGGRWNAEKFPLHADMDPKKPTSYWCGHRGNVRTKARQRRRTL